MTRRRDRGRCSYPEPGDLLSVTLDDRTDTVVVRNVHNHGGYVDGVDSRGTGVYLGRPAGGWDRLARRPRLTKAS